MCSFDWDFYWNASSITIAFGVLWAYQYEKITAFCKKYYYIILLGSIVGYIAGMAFMPVFYRVFSVYPSETISTNICCLFLCIIILLLSMKLSLGNPVTAFLGKISYEIYLIHGFYMILLARINSLPMFWYTLLVVVLTIGSAYGLHLVNTAVLNRYKLFLKQREGGKSIKS